MEENKKTFYSNVNTSRKRKISEIQEAAATKSLAYSSSKSDFCNAVSNGIELDNKTTDKTKSSNCKIDLLYEATKKFDSDKISDQIITQASFSNKLNYQSSNQIKLSDQSDFSSVSSLLSIINKVKKLPIHPSIHVFSIKSKEERNFSLSAADVSQNLSHVAYSFPHSHEIRLFAQRSLSDDIFRSDIRSTWLNFQSAKSHLTKFEGKARCLSSPKVYTFGHNDDVTGLCFSPDSDLLLSCSLDGSVKAISTTTYRVLQHYDCFGSCTDIDVNSKTTHFATTSFLPLNSFHMAYLYDFQRKYPVQSFSGHTDFLKCIRFHPNGLYLATAASDKSIKIWSVLQSKEVRCFKDEIVDHPEKIVFSPDGLHIASTHRRCVKIWDIASGKELKCLKIPNPKPCILNVCYSMKGDMLAAGGSDGEIHVWDIKSDERLEKIPHYNLLKSTEFGKTIVSIKYVPHFFTCVTI